MDGTFSAGIRGLAILGAVIVFDVMFANAIGIARSTGRHPNLVGPDGIQRLCAH